MVDNVQYGQAVISDDALTQSLEWALLTDESSYICTLMNKIWVYVVCLLHFRL